MPMLPQALMMRQPQGPQTPPVWTDPYEAERQRITARMNAPQAPAFTPEQASERQSQNQNEYELGLLGQLSGNEQLGNVGGTMLKRALSMRDPKVSEHGTTNQLTGQFTYSPEYLQQRDEQQLAGVEAKSAASRGAFDAARIAAGEKSSMQQDRYEMMGLIKGMSDDGKKAQNDQRVWRGEDALRNDYDRLTKDLREEVNATGKVTQIIAANAGKRPDAITQQSLVVLLNKFLDPGSVVREGEFNRVVQAQGLAGQAANLRDYVMSGQPLSTQAIEQINGLAQIYAKAAQNKTQSIATQYVRIAEHRGFDPANVISDPTYRGGGAAPPAPGGGAIDVGAMLNRQPAPTTSMLPKATGAAYPGGRTPPGAAHSSNRTVQVEY